MKRFIILFFLLIFSLFFAGCTRVTVTPSDELTMSNWQHISKSGAEANLSFSDEVAKLSLKPASEDEAVVLEGIYSADKEKLYITDESKMTTYVFDYTVYSDRAYISYKENKIEFKREIPSTENIN